MLLSATFDSPGQVDMALQTVVGDAYLENKRLKGVLVCCHSHCICQMKVTWAVPQIVLLHVRSSQNWLKLASYKVSLQSNTN